MDAETISLYVNTESTFFFEYILKPNKLDFDQNRQMYYKWPGYDAVKLVANEHYVYCWLVSETNPWEQKVLVYKRRDTGGDGFSYWSLDYDKYFPMSTSESGNSPYLDILEVTATSFIRSYETGKLKLVMSQQLDTFYGDLKITGSSNKDFIVVNTIQILTPWKEPPPVPKEESKAWIWYLAIGVVVLLGLVGGLGYYFVVVRKKISKEDQEYSKVKDLGEDQSLGDASDSRL